MVRVRAVRDLDDLAAAGAGRHVRARARAAQLVDAQVAVRARVEDVEEPALGVVGGERHREQAALALVEVDDVTHVEERAAQPAAALAHLDEPVLRDDELARAVAPGRGDVRGVAERPDLREPETRTRSVPDRVRRVGAGVNGVTERRDGERGDRRQRGDRQCGDHPQEATPAHGLHVARMGSGGGGLRGVRAPGRLAHRGRSLRDSQRTARSPGSPRRRSTPAPQSTSLLSPSRASTTSAASPAWTS